VIFFFLALFGLIWRPSSGLVQLGLYLTVLCGLFWSTVMVAIGIMGVYVARTYKDSRGRPRYIVRDTIGWDKENAAGRGDPASAGRVTTGPFGGESPAASRQRFDGL
jgi:hypothetical protein